VEHRTVVNPSNIAEDEQVLDIVRRALAEDVGTGDVTTNSLVSDTIETRAAVISRGDYVVSGTTVAAAVFREMDADTVCNIVVADHVRTKSGATVMELEGKARSILVAERTALNFLQRMTGIATLTDKFVSKARPHGVAILDTRKTTPTLRKLEKYAVLCGGGENHRMGLHDRVLVKDNHRRLWCEAGSGGLDAAVEKARAEFPGVPVEVEVESEAELEAVLKASPDWVLLDNMSADQLRRCVEICGGRSRVEASGGIDLDNVEEVARTGVDSISLGCLTHSAPAADLSLEVL